MHSAMIGIGAIQVVPMQLDDTQLEEHQLQNLRWEEVVPESFFAAKGMVRIVMCCGAKGHVLIDSQPIHVHNVSL